MPVFYPDNDNRKNRVYQLANESATYLTSANTNFAILQNQLKLLNSEVEAAYKAINATPPSVTTIDISSGLNDVIGPVNTESTYMEVASYFRDIGWLATTSYLKPIAARVLVQSKIISEEVGSKIILKSVSQFFDRFTKAGTEAIEITWADVLGSLVAGVVGGVLVVAIDAAFDAYEESEQREQLRNGIQEFLPIRTTMKLADAKCAALLTSVQSVSNVLAVLDKPTEEEITSLITKVVAKAQTQVDAITPQTITELLKSSDIANNSWTNEDDPASY